MWRTRLVSAGWGAAGVVAVLLVVIAVTTIWVAWSDRFLLRDFLLAGSTNVIGTVVTDVNGQADSSASDAALFSQVAADWNALSRCDTGS